MTDAEKKIWNKAMEVAAEICRYEFDVCMEKRDDEDSKLMQIVYEERATVAQHLEDEMIARFYDEVD